MTDTITFYPLFPDLLPPLVEDELGALRESLLVDGLRHPIVRLRTPYGAIVDGWHRYLLCLELGIEPQFETVSMTPHEAKAWVIRQHIGRRNLTKYQRAVLALTLKPALAQAAKERMKALSPGETPRSTLQELGDLSDTSADMIYKVSVIETTAPPYIKALVSGQEVSVNRAFQLTRALETAGPIARNIAGKYEVDDPALLEEVKRGESAEAEWVGELLLSGCVSIAETDETVSIQEGAGAIARAVQKRAEEHRRQAVQARYLDILIDKRSISTFEYSVAATGQLTISLTAEEYRKFDSALGKSVIVFVAVEAS